MLFKGIRNTFVLVFGTMYLFLILILFVKKYIFSLLFLIVAANITVFAEETASNLIQGTVQSASGEPLDYVSIYIKGVPRAVFSDEKGHFLLNVPRGKQELVFSLLGYKNKRVEIQTKKGEAQTLNIVLEEFSRELSEVVVSGKSEKKEIETKGFAVHVVETQRIAVQSIQTNELLGRTAGVRIRQDGGLGSRANYNINGLSGNAIKIFINGVPASNFGASFSLNSIPPALIERIEVYKGVVPGHLSEDALGGAINIVLKTKTTNSLAASYSFGSFNTHQSNITGNFRTKKGLTIDLAAFHNYSDNSYEVWGKDIKFKNFGISDTKSNGQKVRRFHDAYESFGGKFNFGFTNVKWADQFLIGAILSQNYKEMQNGATMQVVYGNRHSRRKSDVFTLNYSKKDFLLDRLTLKVDANYSFLNQQVIDTIGIIYDWLGPVKKQNGSYAENISGSESGNAQTAAINKDYVIMVRGNLSYKIHKNHTVFASYMFNDFQRKVSDEQQVAALQMLRNTRDLQKNVLSFTYENLAFSGRLRTNIFYKRYSQKVTANEPYLDSNDKEYKVNITEKDINHSGYGMTLSFALLPDLYLLASGEKALRLPSANELFGNGAENSLSAIGLKPESSLNANIGFNYGYRINQHAFRLNSSLYFRDTKDMIREALNGRNDYTQAENLEDVFTRGVDAELNYSYADKLDFRFNISKFDVLFNRAYKSNGEPYNYYRMQIRNEPSFKFNGQITYHIKNLFQKRSKSSVYYNISYVNGFLRNWSNVGSNNLDYIPMQCPMDIGLTHTFPKNKFVLSFDAKNVLDQQVFDNFGLQKPGRAFYGKITCFIF